MLATITKRIEEDNTYFPHYDTIARNYQFSTYFWKMEIAKRNLYLIICSEIIKRFRHYQFHFEKIIKFITILEQIFNDAR